MVTDVEVGNENNVHLYLYVREYTHLTTLITQLLYWLQLLAIQVKIVHSILISNMWTMRFVCATHISFTENFHILSIACCLIETVQGIFNLTSGIRIAARKNFAIWHILFYEFDFANLIRICERHCLPRQVIYVQVFV